jgi:hypothetical protein
MLSFILSKDDNGEEENMLTFVTAQMPQPIVTLIYCLI